MKRELSGYYIWYPAEPAGDDTCRCLFFQTLISIIIIW
jgi:hypothetical protein